MLGGELGGDMYIDAHVEVAAVTRAKVGHAFSTQPEDSARGGAPGDTEAGLTAQGLHFELAAKRKRGEGYRERAGEVISITFEALMILNPDDEIEVARRRPARACRAVAGRA